MRLLKDDEILSAIRDDGVIANLDGHPNEIDLSRNSPVQPASLRLHVGKIYVPDAKEDEPGSVQTPKGFHTLKRGEIVVLTTREVLKFPNDLA